MLTIKNVSDMQYMQYSCNGCIYAMMCMWQYITFA